MTRFERYLDHVGAGLRFVRDLAQDVSIYFQNHR